MPSHAVNTNNKNRCGSSYSITSRRLVVPGWLGGRSWPLRLLLLLPFLLLLLLELLLLLFVLAVQLLQLPLLFVLSFLLLAVGGGALLESLLLLPMFLLDALSLLGLLLAEPIEFLLVPLVQRGIGVWRSQRRSTVSVARSAIRWPVWTFGVAVRRATRFHSATAAPLAGPNTGGHVWPAVVHRSMQSPICAGGLLMLCLLRGHGDAPLTVRRDFSICRPGSDASRAPVKADSVCRVVNYGGVLIVAHNCDVHVGHGAVVEVRAAFPVATEKANTGVAEAVVDSAIVADLRSPVPGVP